MLENSLNAKEKLISELNMELHNIETTLSNEREEHMNEVKKLTAMLNEKVIVSRPNSFKDFLHVIFQCGISDFGYPKILIPYFWVLNWPSPISDALLVEISAITKNS